MRIFIFLTLFFLLSLASVEAQNLDLKISGDFRNQNLNEVLKKFQTKYDLKFAFDERRLSSINVDQIVKPIKLKEFLNIHLSPNELSFLILDNTIIIKPIDQIPEDLLPEIMKPKPYALSGFVYDVKTGERLPYASVEFGPAKFSTGTNLNGFFSIRDIKIDSGILKIYYIGYGRIEVKVSRSKAEEVLRIGMTSENSLLSEVLIEGNPNAIMKIGDEVSTVNINPAQMLNLPNLGEVDIFRSIQLLPGITGTFETASSINIRGSGPDNNLILYDGFNVYHLDHFFGIFSAFNIHSIKNIKLYKGGFESKYGGRVGGVLDITGKTGNSQKPVIGVGMNFVGVNSLVEIPIGKKTTFFVSARRSLTDAIPSSSYKELIENVLNNDINSSTSGGFKSYDELDPLFNFYDVNAKVSHRFSDEEILSLSLYHGRDLLRIENSQSFETFNFITENKTRWGNIGLGLNYNRQWEKNFYSNFSLGVSNYFSRVTEGANKDYLNANKNLNELILFEQRNDVDDVSLKIDNGWNYSTNNQLEFGLSSTNNIISFSVFEDSIFTEELSEAATLSGAYIQNRFRFAQRAEVVPGIRLNYFDLTKDVLIEPRISANYKIIENLKIKSAFGRYSQMVSRVLRKDVFASNPDFWVLSNGDDIPILKSTHLIGGFTYTISKKFIFDVEIYKKWDTGVLEYIPPEGIFANSAPADFPRYFRGKGTSKGIEFLLQKQGKIFNGWVSYAYSFSDNQFEELNESERYPSNQDQRHEVKFVSIFNVRKFEFSSIWIYGSGRPYTAPLGNFQLNSPGKNDLEVLYVSDINSFRLPEYHRLDLSVTYNLSLPKMEADIGFSIFNVYNRKNIKNRRFNRIDPDLSSNSNFIGNTNYVQNDLFLLGFTPNLSLQLTF